MRFVAAQDRAAADGPYAISSSIGCARRWSGNASNSINALRGHLAELGIISAKGRNGTAELLKVIANAEDDRIPPVARFCLDVLARQY